MNKLHLLFPTLLFAIDRLFLGHYSTDALASMQISGSYLFVLLSLFGAFTVGMTSSIERASASHKSTVMRAAILMSLLVGFAVSILSLATLDPVLSLFSGANAATIQNARAYLLLLLPAFPFYLLVVALHNSVKASFPLAGIAASLHLILNSLLIFGAFGIAPQGIVGAAISSVVATLFQCLFLLIFLTKSPHVRYYLWDFGGEFAAFKEIAKNSLTAIWERTLQYGVFFAWVLLLCSLGTDAMATNQVLVSIGALAFLAADGAHLLLKRAKITIFISFLFLTAFAFIFFTVAEPTLRLFTKDPELLSLGSQVLTIFALTLPLSAISVVITAETKPSTRINILGITVRLIASYYLAYTLGLGLVGIWWGVACDWLVRALLQLPLLWNSRTINARGLF